MKFIVGGEYSGKLKFALKLSGLTEKDVIDCEYMDIEKECDKPIINHFNLAIKKMAQIYDDDEIIKQKIKCVLKNNKKSIIISNEIGYGIVPIDKFDRRYRELVGRICSDVAKESDNVYRVVSGIGIKIK